MWDGSVEWLDGLQTSRKGLDLSLASSHSVPPPGSDEIRECVKELFGGEGRA